MNKPCECGCGEPVKRRFLPGHNTHKPWEWRVEDRGYETPCWIWDRPLSRGKGYGSVTIGGRIVGAHRAVYEKLCGPVPVGLELDHLCRVLGCVNPDHLEPVTTGENVRRSMGPAGINARKTHCKRGHAFTPENTHIRPSGHRKCRTCAREAAAARYRAKRRAREIARDAEQRLGRGA